jgi:hypothetical protein
VHNQRTGDDDHLTDKQPRKFLLPFHGIAPHRGTAEDRPLSRV